MLVTWVLGEVKRIEYPSGADRATASAPIMPFAPPRFSTTTACPSACVIVGAISRARMSVPFPGGNGTTIFTGREGHCCASAWPRIPRPARSIKPNCTDRCTLSSLALPVSEDPPAANDDESRDFYRDEPSQRCCDRPNIGL